MEHLDKQTLILPPTLLAEIEAAAAVEQRSTQELVREAVELYLQDRRPNAAAGATGVQRTPLQAAARMLERRRHHPLPAGSTIRELTTQGRA